MSVPLHHCVDNVKQQNKACQAKGQWCGCGIDVEKGAEKRHNRRQHPLRSGKIETEIRHLSTWAQDTPKRRFY
jgi:hypothetical protein